MALPVFKPLIEIPNNVNVALRLVIFRRLGKERANSHLVSVNMHYELTLVIWKNSTREPIAVNVRCGRTQYHTLYPRLFLNDAELQIPYGWCRGFGSWLRTAFATSKADECYTHRQTHRQTDGQTD